MKIQDMTRREKSIKLLSLAGCNIEPITETAGGLTFQHATFTDDYWIRVCDDDTLYDEDNMAMAWRVLNWAHDFRGGDKFFLFYSLNITVETIPPDEAQAAWLDKILARAIEYGLVE